MSPSIENFGTSPAFDIARIFGAQSDAAVEPDAAHTSAQPGREADSVELSDAALWFSMNDGGIRRGLVEDVRARIANGSYDTTDRLEAAADSLINSL
ncbi:MAG: hypothetical protein JSR77_15365 [Planctomycetes bacterium]|nr:hypothetical protein [Planctomycetota bacterium]